MNYTPGKQALEKARNNVTTKFNRWISVELWHVGISNESALMNKSIKSFKMKRKWPILQGNINKGQYILRPCNHRINFTRRYTVPFWIYSIRKHSESLNHVREVILLSHTHSLPHHLVSTKSTGYNLCDEACERHINVGFCSHAIAVALFTESFEKYISYLNWN